MFSVQQNSPVSQTNEKIRIC